MKIILNSLKVICFCILLFFFTSCASSPSINEEMNVCLLREKLYADSYRDSSIMKKSNYQYKRDILPATDFVKDNIDHLPFISATPLSSIIKIGADITKVSLYVEDGIYTYQGMRKITDKILSTTNVAKIKNDYPEVYTKFEKYLKKSVWAWIPDRDYPQIGYLPKELLYDKCLGEKDITKYWPEASIEDKEKYVAMTFDELFFNYDLILDDLLKKQKNI